MNTYAFLTKKGERFDVKASTEQAAINKVKSMPYLLEIADGRYYKYDSQGLHSVYSGYDGNFKEEENV